MTTLRQKHLVSCSLAGLALAGLALGASASPLVFENASAVDAARQISEKFGISVVLKSDFVGPHRVSFTLTDADSPGSQLEAVNDLANALNADFTKTFVVSKVPADQDVPSPDLDSTGDVHFDSMTVPAQTAIATVAGVDDAEARIVGDVSGNVTLSATQLSATSAATEIATQTHTRWKAFYALTSKAGGHTSGGRVVDHTANGSPIVELPHVYYRHVPTPAELQAQQQAEQQAQAGQQTNGYPDYGNGYDPYGGGYNYGDPYGYGAGYSGYGMPGYGNYPGGYGPGGGYFDNGNGLIVNNSNAYDGPIVF